MKNCCDPDIDNKLKQPADLKLVVSVVMQDEDGRLLLAKRPDGKDMPGMWEFPGGKVADNETPEIALIREVNEELGVTICAGCLVPLTFTSYRYEHFHLLMPVFLCREWKQHPKAMEGQEFKWVKKNDLPNYVMPEANQIIVTRVRDLL